MSRQIIFGRHAKSSWADPGQPDFDRPLNERGKKDSPLMAQRLSNAGVTPQAILASAAVRARQTAHAFAQQFKIEEQLFPSLYHAAPDSTWEYSSCSHLRTHACRRKLGRLVRT